MGGYVFYSPGLAYTTAARRGGISGDVYVVDDAMDDEAIQHDITLYYTL